MTSKRVKGVSKVPEAWELSGTFGSMGISLETPEDYLVDILTQVPLTYFYSFTLFIYYTPVKIYLVTCEKYEIVQTHNRHMHCILKCPYLSHFFIRLYESCTVEKQKGTF